MDFNKLSVEYITVELFLRKFIRIVLVISMDKYSVMYGFSNRVSNRTI